MAVDSTIETIRREARSLVELTKHNCDPEVFAKLFDTLYDRASAHTLGLYLRPLFEAVLKKFSGTAWVCSDDKTAGAALKFLTEKSTSGFPAISVVGFDNLMGDLGPVLSSYDFNMHGIIQQALMMIADAKTFKTKPVISEVDGYLVERKSLRKVA